MENIKEVNPLTKREKMLLKLKNFLRLKTISYSIGAAVGVVGGQVAQNTYRDTTGYDPVKHGQLEKELRKDVGNFEDFKKEKQEEREKGLGDWYKILKEKIEKNGMNPMEYIKDSKTYKEILLNFYKMQEVGDKVSFYAPALLIFIMLGGYINRKLTTLSGDPVRKEELRQITEKINELVGEANRMRELIESKGVESLTPEEFTQIRALLSGAHKFLPAPDEIPDDTIVSKQKLDLEL
jgi:hypothetical protein